MASKRRRRMEVQESSLFLLIVFNLMILESISFPSVTATILNQQYNTQSDYSIQNNHHTENGGGLSSTYKTMSSQQQQQQPDSIASSPTAITSGSTLPQSQQTSTAHLCSLVPHDISKHLKLCKLIRHSSQANEAITMGASKGLAECRAQFSKERWNCTHVGGDHHLLISELTQSVGNREGSFVQAIAAAGIVHSIATACSVGSLADCACDKTRIGIIKRQEDNWKWGGCSNNIRHGMLYAKHLVELLDVAHEHHFLKLHNRHHHLHHQQQLSNYHQQRIATNVSTNTRHFEKRSLSSNSGRQREFFSQTQLRSGRPPIPLPQQQTIYHQSDSSMNVGNHSPEDLNFCKQNHNISKTIHIQLIKSLLSKNSLEKHQEIRLAMNMHNNKIGRMAVAKNMEIRCRCHGLSGSCSLKTCWLLLPSFQTIGNYLKKKYELSVHLPSAIDLNKLIPMMDRNEITAILNNKHGTNTITSQPQHSSGSEIIQSSASHHYQQPVVSSSAMTSGANNFIPTATITTTDTNQQGLSPYEGSRIQSSSSPTFITVGQPAPEFAALVSPASSLPSVLPDRNLNRPQISAHFIVVPTTQSPITKQHYNNHNNLSMPLNVMPTNHHNYYERHKQLMQLQQSSQHISTILPQPHNYYNATMTTNFSDEQSTIEIPTNLSPMTQQQYQSLLRDMKLCSTSTINGSSAGSSGGSSSSSNKQLMTRDLNGQENELGVNSNHKYHRTQLHNTAMNKKHQSLLNQHNGHQLKQANQQLSQLLQPYDKDALIHLHKSPSYCEPDHRHGFAGIQSRICNKDKNAPDSCDKLCCGRGSRTLIYKNSYKCECKFQYCCSIYCNVCEQKIQLEVCN